jgi:ribonuclease P protein component
LTREADFSTLEAGAQAPPRFPLAHGDGRRPQGAQRPSRARPQAPFGLTCAPKSGAPLGKQGDRPPARLKKRPDFVRASKGLRAHAASLALQSVNRDETPDAPPRIGLTTTRALGNAVVRNRIRRRLRAALARISPVAWERGHDYVVVARSDALRREFSALVDDLSGALKRSKKQRETSRGVKSNRV